MYIVTFQHNGQTFPLRGTVIAMSRDRATEYASIEEARAALAKAKKFMKAATYKTAMICPTFK